MSEAAEPVVRSGLGRGIQNSVLHMGLGLALGAIIETCLPSYVDGASIQSQALELMVQSGLNGCALSVVCPILRKEKIKELIWVMGQRCHLECANCTIGLSIRS